MIIIIIELKKKLQISLKSKKKKQIKFLFKQDMLTRINNKKDDLFNKYYDSINDNLISHIKYNFIHLN